MKKPFICETFLDLQYLSDPKISPDGKYTAFILKKANIKSNGYESNLYVVDNRDNSMRKMNSLSMVAAYEWEDEETILFPGMRSAKVKEEVANGEERTSFYALNIHGGEAVERFTVPLKGASLYPLGNKEYIIMATYDNGRPDVSECTPDERKRELLEYKRKGYEYIDEVPFSANGIGILNKRRSRLYRYNEVTGDLEALTTPLFRVSGVKVYGKNVVYTGQEFADVKGLKDAIYFYNAETRETTCLLEKDLYSIKFFEVGKDVVIVSMTDGKKHGSNQNGDLYKFNLMTGERTLFAEHQHHNVWNTVTTDVKLGGGRMMKIDGDKLYCISTVDMDARIERFDLTTGEQEYLTETGAVDFIDVHDGKIICIAFKGMGFEEMYRIEDGEWNQVTHFNDEVKEQYEISMPEFLSVKGSSPFGVEGYVLKPVGYEEGKKYPGLLAIHGGPRLTYGPIFMHQMQIFTSAGYFVFFCNPRGAEGRGDEFGDIKGRLGTVDFDDIMEFTDAVLEKYPDIDKDRVGVEGGSYGGFMTNWIIGHTDRFAAACAQRSVSNWSGMEGTSDIGFHFCPGNTGVSHMEDHDAQWRQAPLSGAHKCVTPTLFIHGSLDYRCWQQEAYQMYAALKMHGCPAKLCLFEGENHELSRSGRPKQRLQRLVEMFDWFEKYLKTDEKEAV